MIKHHIKCIACLALSALAWNCSDKKEFKVDEKNSTSNGITYNYPHETKEVHLKNIASLKLELEKELASANPDQANALYEKYSELLIKELTSLNYADQETLDQYVNYLDGQLPDSIIKKQALFKESKIEYWYEGEGMYSLQFFYNYFYEIFKDKVTPDLKEFLYIKSEEDKILFLNDSNITVPWKVIRSRVLTWDNFIKKYPLSRYNAMAKEIYAFYMSCYLIGTDNTLTFEYDTRKLYPEVKADFEELIAENPETWSAALTENFKNYYLQVYPKVTDPEAFFTTMKTYVHSQLATNINDHEHDE